MDPAIYVRVSTQDQNLDRQLESTFEYCESELGVEKGEVEVYRDKSTGTNVDRSGYRDLMDDVEAGEVGVVVVHSLTRLTRSMRDLQRIIEKIDENEAEIHFVNDPITFSGWSDDPMDKLMLQLFGALAEWEAEMAQIRTKEGLAARMNNEEYHHGPAPLGFDKEDGRLIEGENYDRVCAVLDMVAKGEMSKRKAADELDCGRATIGRAIGERGDLYGL